MIDPPPAGSEPHSDAERFIQDIAGMEYTPPRQPADDATSRATLDAAIRAHAADKLNDGEIIVNWVVLAGTRNHHGGGYVITLLHDHMPRWEAEGVLRRGLKAIDADVDPDDTDEEG